MSGALYHGRYERIGPLGYLWGGNVMLGSIALALNTAMLVLGDYRRLALVDLAGAVVTVGGGGRRCWPGSTTRGWWWPPWPGQATQIALMAAALRARLRHGLAVPA